MSGESCKQQFRDLLEASKRKDGYVLKVFSKRRVLNHSQRYGMWTANVDILETGPHSLDFRLKEKKILRDYILGILNEINQHLSRGKYLIRVPFEVIKFDSVTVITIATTPQRAITSELYIKTSDSSPDVTEEEVKNQEMPSTVTNTYNALADEEEICDEIIEDRLNSLFEIASELPSNDASVPMGHARYAIRNVQSALTPGAEQADPSSTGGIYRRASGTQAMREHVQARRQQEERDRVQARLQQEQDDLERETLPRYSVKKGRSSKKYFDNTSNRHVTTEQQ